MNITEKDDFLQCAAAELCDQGFSIIPIQPEDKKPLVPWAEYQDHAATADEVANWWDIFPNANIGIITGEIVVIDCDSMTAAAWVADNLTPTPWSVQTARGAHFYYRCEDGDKWQNGAGIREGVDVRGSGGYVVAPPSIHKTGAVYTWHKQPGADSIDELPTLCEADRARLYGQHGGAVSSGYDGRPVQTGQRNAAAASQAGKCYQKGYTYDQALAFLREWNARNFPPLPEKELQTVCLSMEKTHQKNNGAQVIPIMAPKAIVTARTDSAPRLNLDRAMPSGDMRRIFEYANKHGRMNAPTLTLAATLTSYAALVGRNYESEGGNRCNLMTLALAPTGAGKDAARQAIKKLFSENSAADQVLGADDFASASAIVKRLVRHPRALFMVDEFGMFISNIQHKNASANRQEIRGILMKLYSDNRSVFKFKEYATESTPQVNQPHVCLYGTTTPEPLFNSLTTESVKDGFLNRFIMFYHPKRHKRTARPEHIQEAGAQLAAIIEQAAEYQGTAGGNVADIAHVGKHDPLQVYTDSQAFDIIEALDLEFSRRQDSGDACADLWARVCENANKLALLHAISRNPAEPRIQAVDAHYGAYLARYSCELMTWAANRFMAESQHDRNRQKVIDAIKAGGGALTRSEVLRKCRALRAREVEEIVSELQSSGELVIAADDRAIVYRVV